MKLSEYFKNNEDKFSPSENNVKNLEDDIVKPFAIYAAQEFDKLILDEVNNTYRAICKTRIKIDKNQFIKDVEDLKKYREKETPMKVTKLNWDDEVVGKVTEYHCPSCDKSVSLIFKYKYCPNCGQKLDWSKE